MTVTTETGTEYRSCPAKPGNDTDFLNIGHAGGDPLTHCENTIEATKAGLAKGMNVVELDLCITSDGIPFLWHDCDMYDALSMFRRLGWYAPNNNCLPHVHPSMRGRNPTDFPFAIIQRRFGYKASWNKNDRLPYTLPSLERCH